MIYNYISLEIKTEEPENNIKKNFKKFKKKLIRYSFYINNFIIIFFHILLLSLFEPYFYFCYVTKIENKLILNEVDQYIEIINILEISPIIKKYFKNNYGKIILNNYKNHLLYQSRHKYNLLVKSFSYALIIFLVFSIFLILGIIIKEKIYWKWIILENLIMISLLASFEIVFFWNIILQYNPVNNDEINYYVYNKILN